MVDENCTVLNRLGADKSRWMPIRLSSIIKSVVVYRRLSGPTQQAAMAAVCH